LNFQRIYLEPMKDDRVLNLLELRECIQNNENVTYYQEACHNGEPFNLTGYLGYFGKNIFYFVKCIKNNEEKELRKDNALCFVPIEYQ
jgi:hypothetical protein